MSYPTTVHDIKTAGYVLYQMDWKESHGITLEKEIFLMKKYVNEYLAYSSSHANQPYMTYNEWITENGYNGMYFACFEEFLENEYQDKEYMLKLFFGMKEDFITEYLNDIENMELE